MVLGFRVIWVLSFRVMRVFVIVSGVEVIFLGLSLFSIYGGGF